MKKLLLLAVSLTAALSAFAVVASPEPFQQTQPDGSVITVKLVGDEFHHYYARPDGTPLRRLESGFFVEDKSVSVIPVVQRAQRIAAQEKAFPGQFPLTGSPHSIVLLVGFADLPFAQSKNDFEQLLNEVGYSYNGATGSCRDYFIAASDSIFQPTFDAYGPYTLSNNMAYYGAVSGSSNDVRPAQMIIEACQIASEAGVDFSQYDYDNNGVLDNVFVFFAGHNQAEGGGESTIWPHKGDVQYYGVKVNGKTISTYACTSEYKGSSGTVRCGIGTFTHEFGHVLGLPDFYDTDYNNYTVGNWDIMSSGSYNNNSRTPPTYSAYERFFLGWLNPEQLTEPGQFMLEPLETSNSAYLIAVGAHNLSGTSPNPSEFFILEYRERIGWDSPSGALPGTGMLVWHVDYNSTSWYNNTPNNGSMLRMHLEEANGIPWSSRTRGEDGRASDAYPYDGRYTTFQPTLHDGTILTDQKVFDIEQVGTTAITFVYSALGDANLAFNKARLDFVTTVSDKKTIVDWEPQSVTLVGHKLPDEVTLTAVGSFRMFAGEEYPARTSVEWKSTLTLNPVDSVIDQKIWVMYAPSAQNCNKTESQISVKGDGLSFSLPVSGQAPRPTYITAPELKETSNITSSSFQIGWSPVTDAEEYYITVFQIKDGESLFTQSFEDFSTADAITGQGWSSTTTTTTTSTKADGTRSLHLQNTGDQVTTPLYDAPVTAVSFWLNAFVCDLDTVGTLLFEAYNGEEWKEVENISVLRTTKKKTLEYAFAVEDNYIRFRLTYTYKNAATALDLMQMTCSKQITYTAQGREMTIRASSDEAYNICNVTGLQSATDYYYKVQCTDLEKGCEEHLSDFSPIVKVTTLMGETDDRHLSLSLSGDVINVHLTSPAEGNELQVFDHMGQYVCTISVHDGQTTYELPSELFFPGTVYIVKYVENNKMLRKQRFAKFAF